MVLSQGESCSVPAQDRLNTWTLGGIAIDQVSTYRYLGVVEDGSWQAHAQRRSQRCKPMGTGMLSCSSLPTKVRLLMVQTFILRGHVWRGSVGHDEGGQRQDVSGRKALRSILALHPRDCSSDVLYGDTGLLPPVYSLMLPNCVGSDART
jgi:hypothetical protein